MVTNATANHPPTIAQQPLSQSVFAAGAATFIVVESSGDAGLQWRKNAVEIAGADEASYTTPPALIGDSGTVFDCEVSNDFGTVLSNAVVLLVVGATGAQAPAPAPVTAPTISQQPTPQSVTAPATATFTVVATTGGGTLAYQWSKTVSGTTTPITGATSASYTTPATSTADSGASFSCVVSNSAGSVTSNTASLTVAAQGTTPDTRPRYGFGSATAGVSNPAALLAAMTATGSNGSKAATFTVTPGAGQYGWFACDASASTSGVTFSGPDGTGGWQGASSSGNNGADDGSSPNTSGVTYSDGTTTWRFLRQSFSGAAGTFTTS